MYKYFATFVFLIQWNFVLSQQKIAGFYSIKRSTSELCFIDLKGNTSTIGEVNLPLSLGKYHGLDINPITNELYFIGPNKKLYVINKDNGSADFKHDLKDNSNHKAFIPCISFTPSGDLFIFEEYSGFQEGALKNVSFQSQSLHLTSNNNTIGLPSVLGIEFDNSGNLWGVDECCMNKIHKIDFKIGKSITDGNLSLKQEFPTDLDFSNNNLYGIAIGNETSSTSTTFYKVDITTGQSQTLFILDDIYVGLAGDYRDITKDSRAENLKKEKQLNGDYIKEKIVYSETTNFENANSTIVNNHHKKVQKSNVYYNSAGEKYLEVTKKDTITSHFYFKPNGDTTGAFFLIGKDLLYIINSERGSIIITKEKLGDKYFGIIEYNPSKGEEISTLYFEFTYEQINKLLLNKYKNYHASGFYVLKNKKNEKISEGSIMLNLLNKDEDPVASETKNYQQQKSTDPIVMPIFYTERYGNCKYCNKKILGKLKSRAEIDVEIGFANAFAKMLSPEEINKIPKNERTIRINM